MTKTTKLTVSGKTLTFHKGVARFSVETFEPSKVLEAVKAAGLKGEYYTKSEPLYEGAYDEYGKPLEAVLRHCVVLQGCKTPVGFTLAE